MSTQSLLYVGNFDDHRYIKHPDTSTNTIIYKN